MFDSVRFGTAYQMLTGDVNILILDTMVDVVINIRETAIVVSMHRLYTDSMMRIIKTFLSEGCISSEKADTFAFEVLEIPVCTNLGDHVSLHTIVTGISTFDYTFNERIIRRLLHSDALLPFNESSSIAITDARSWKDLGTIPTSILLEKRKLDDECTSPRKKSRQM